MGVQLPLIPELGKPPPPSCAQVKRPVDWLPKSKRINRSKEMEQVSLPGADEYHEEKEQLRVLRESRSCPSLEDEDGIRLCPFIACRHHLWEVSNGHGFLGRTDEDIVQDLVEMPVHCIHDAIRELESCRLTEGVLSFELIGPLMRFTPETARAITEGALEQLGDDWEIFQLEDD